MAEKRLLRNICLLYVLYLNLVVALGTSKFYEYYARNISTGSDVHFDRYKGKVVLVVNVASECGYTRENYVQLVQLQKLFKQEDFAILAFPCNQFGGQESERNHDIWQFLKGRYHVNFDVFQKVEVVGGYAHPLYDWLKEQVGGEEPSWNFVKYLINQQGEVVRMAATYVYPMVLKPDIESLLAGQILRGGVLQHHENSVEEVEHTEL